MILMFKYSYWFIVLKRSIKWSKTLLLLLEIPNKTNICSTTRLLLHAIVGAKEFYFYHIVSQGFEKPFCLWRTYIYLPALTFVFKIKLGSSTMNQSAKMQINQSAKFFITDILPRYCAPWVKGGVVKMCFDILGV